jgi:Protein of unknown function (DUF4012)
LSDQERDLQVGGDGEPESPRGIDKLNLEIDEWIKKQAELADKKRAEFEAAAATEPVREDDPEPVAEPDKDLVIDLRDRVPAKTPTRRPKKRRRRRRWPRYVIVLAVLAVVALLADVVYVGLGLRTRMLSARASLTNARSDLEDGDYIAASNQFTSAREDARGASGLVARPGGWALRQTPFTSSDARTVEVLIDVTNLVSRAGLDAVDMFDRLGVASGGFAGSFFRAGHFRLQPMGTTRKGVDGLLALFSKADNLLEEDLDPFVPEIEDALATARSQVSETLATLTRADLVLSATPTLLGEGQDRHYLFVLQDPAQSRSSGGVIRYYGVLGASEGKLHLGKVRPIRKFTHRSGAGVRNFNLTPDFPTVARWLLAYFEERTGRELDGVIASDPLVLQRVTGVTGPVREEGYSVAVNSENAAQVLMHDAVEHFEGRTADRDQWVAAIVEKTWKAVTRGVGETSALLDALDISARTQHLKVYTTSAEAQRALDDLQITGDMAVYGPNAQLVAQNSRIASQVDFFLRRRVDTRINLRSDGSAMVKTSVRVENRSPEGPPSSVLGFDHPGLARLSLETLLPEGARNITVLPADGNAGSRRGTTAERPSLSIDMRIPADSTSTATFSYAIPNAVAENGSFNFTFVPTSLAFPDEGVLRVDAADGSCFAPCELLSSGRWLRRGTFETPWRVAVRVVPLSD